MTPKLIRFAWRASRNSVCALPGGQRLLFPAAELAARFGPDAASYAFHVHGNHLEKLSRAGFTTTSSILEVGPGRNMGTGLLWWCRMVAEGQTEARVNLWDVHRNADPQAPGYWKQLAGELLDAGESRTLTDAERAILASISSGNRRPDIDYLVCSIEDLQARLDGRQFGLIYSHAALEHVWEIGRFWELAGRLSAPAGWHSHRIDLADHGYRETNYIEMLEWSALAWSLTMRFIPGAINRWRASEHETAVRQAGLQIASADRELRPALPISRHMLALPYRELPEAELRTTAVHLVARAGSTEASHQTSLDQSVCAE